MKPTSVKWFRYEAAASADARPAPLLQAVFESAGKIQSVYGLVDSGSEITCLPGPIARALGCPLSEDVEEVRVFGAAVEARTAVVDMRIATSAGALVFPGIECSVPVSDEGVDFAVLGRYPLFGEVEVRFQDWLGRFGLQRRREFLQGPSRGPSLPPRGALPTAMRLPAPARRRRHPSG